VIMPPYAPPGSGAPYGAAPLALAPQPAGAGSYRVEALPGTEFGVAYLTVPPTVSGLAAGSLVTGIASIGLGLIIGCLGITGMQNSSGPIMAGAFAVLAALLGFAGLGLGYTSIRQIRATPGRFSGRGLGVAGMVCGGVGVLFTTGGLALALILLAS
jgi:hypothetical protein